MEKMILWVLIGLLSRILPHPANVTALTSLNLLAGKQFSKKQAALLIIVSLLGSDIILAYVNHDAVFGSWSFFTYTGFLAIAMLGNKFRHIKTTYFLGVVICSSLLFWAWTNFGTWLFSGLYQKTFSDLLLCYAAALPFLRNAIIGDLCWAVFLLNIFKLKFHCFKSLLLND